MKEKCFTNSLNFTTVLSVCLCSGMSLQW